MNEVNVADDKRVTAVVTLMGYRRTTLRECPTLKTITRMIVFYGTKIRGNPGNTLGEKNVLERERERVLEREREREREGSYLLPERKEWLYLGTTHLAEPRYLEVSKIRLLIRKPLSIILVYCNRLSLPPPSNKHRE
jgi:hypothetical protein